MMGEITMDKVIAIGNVVFFIANAYVFARMYFTLRKQDKLNAQLKSQVRHIPVSAPHMTPPPIPPKRAVKPQVIRLHK